MVPSANKVAPRIIGKQDGACPINITIGCHWIFERQICAQTQDLQIFKKFYMSQMNPKEAFHNTGYSVQLPYIAGLSL